MFKKIFAVINAILFISFSKLNFLVDIHAGNLISLEEKIGQMICLDLRYLDNGSAVTKIDEKTKPLITKLIKKYNVGSFILFSSWFHNNLKDESQTRNLIADLQKIALELGKPPLLICVDQEGGIVERFNFNRAKLKNNINVRTVKEAYEKGLIIGKEMKDLGFNCNFAPVVDVNSNPKNPVIGPRSFGNDAYDVSRKSVAFMNGLHEYGILATAKHFPGHGDTCVDSHLELPVVKKNKIEIEKLELIPFKEMIKNGVDIIMTAHISMPKIDSTKVISKKDGKEISLPATLSKVVLTDLLRKELNFSGLIMTDALVMKAISENFGCEESVALAISAGADIILMPTLLKNEQQIDEKLGEIYNLVINKVNKGEIDEKQIDDSYNRIIKLKKKFVLLPNITRQEAKKVVLKK